MADSRAVKNHGDASLGIEGSNDIRRSRPSKSDRSRRSWSVREEVILLASMKELVAQGWKSDNGFRSGYLNRIEEAIKKEIPSSDLRANPHISSKICSWKKNYSSLVSILGRSGVGFNRDHTIDIDDCQWAQVVKTDSNARTMRNKSWPFFEEWKEIFGKDRANGSEADDVADIVKGLKAKANLVNEGGDEEYIVNLDNIPANDVAADTPEAEIGEDSVCQGAKNNVASKKRGKKRKHSDDVDAMIEMLAKMHDATNARLDGLSARIGYEIDLSAARKDAFTMLGEIEGLSMDETFDVGEILVRNPDRLDFFKGMPEKARAAYVARVLKEKRS